jgi:hypothetical protein
LVLAGNSTLADQFVLSPLGMGSAFGFLRKPLTVEGIEHIDLSEILSGSSLRTFMHSNSLFFVGTGATSGSESPFIVYLLYLIFLALVAFT